LAEAILPATVTKKPDHRGERDISRKTIARGMPGVSGVTVVTMLVCSFYFACEAAGASSARHSLRPLIFEGVRYSQNSGMSCRENAEVCSEFYVIARSDSDEAIHAPWVAPWIASLALAMMVWRRRLFEI
jgi:hypothetical protein